MTKKMLLLALLFLNSFVECGIIPPIQIELTEKSQRLIIDLTERIEKSLERTDRNVDTLVGHLSPEQLSKIVTQAGIALAASTTTVLSAYILYTIVKHEFQRSYDTPTEKMSKKIMAALGISTLCFCTSIAILLKSGKIANSYTTLN